MTTQAHSHSLQGSDPLQGYRPAAGGYDELLAADGTVRPHWQPFLAGMAALSVDQLHRRADKLDRLVRDNGIAYNIFADPDEVDQPWRVDLAPLIISPDEWAWLTRALVQRSRLLNAILSDVYGPQTLMKAGLLPPGLVMPDPAFLRPCHGFTPDGGHMMFCAIDLARGIDGRWRVLDDNAETTAGIGLTLANRILHTHVSSDQFVESNALRLSPFLLELQNELGQRSGRDEPRIVLLTPGPHHDDFFSHAYLARYMGYPLVEGGDLTVVNGRIFLKTLEGLKQVDLIVRCVEAASADPLELSHDGFLGPVGLVRAARMNPEFIVNALGSAFAENRGLGPYLPKLCEHVLGEDLMLSSPTRWWLGDDEARQHVLDNLYGKIIRPIHEGTGRPGQAAFGTRPETLDEAGRAALIAEIERSGWRMVAEEPVEFATAPSWTDDGLRPRSYAVRLFVAGIDHNYQVMPGGLAMTLDEHGLVAMSAPGGEARDVWVTTHEKVGPHVSLFTQRIATAHVERTGRGLQSRVADNLFWLGRYAERAEGIMRLVRGVLTRVGEDSGPTGEADAVRRALDVVLSKDGAGMRVNSGAVAGPDVETSVRTLMFAPDRPYGLKVTLDNLHRTSALTRDRLSLEAWRTLNAFFADRAWRGRDGDLTAGDALDLLDQGLATLSAFSGMAQENMTRNYGWRFLDIGRRIERAITLSELMQSVILDGHPEEDGGLYVLLEFADSFMTYRSRYRVAPMMAPVIDLLIHDEINPRGLGFQIALIDAHINALPRASERTPLTDEQRLVLAILTDIRLSNPSDLAHRNPANGRMEALERVLDATVRGLPDLSKALTRRYFSHAEGNPRWLLSRERGPA